MSKMLMKNASGDKLEIEVIRYFKNNDNEYLIYSLNELVGDGYIKLYASKIIGNSAKIITDDDEWILLKEIIKEIIKTNHEGEKLNVIDLDEDELNGVVLQDTRIFKLQGNLVNLLSDNKKVEKKSIDLPLIEDYEEDDEEIDEKDFETLFEEEKEKNRALNEKINKLEEEITFYKDKMDRIINLIEE